MEQLCKFRKDPDSQRESREVGMAEAGMNWYRGTITPCFVPRETCTAVSSVASESPDAQSPATRAQNTSFPLGIDGELRYVSSP